MAKPKKKGPHLRGEVEVLPLDRVKPNPWNPNQVPEHVMESIKHGYTSDGWLASHALLVWETDEKGKTKRLIIDGEHRWHCANEVGLKEGPMVLLKGITEAEAKGLTVKLNQKRGDWDITGLSVLLKELETSYDELPLEFGFGEEELMRLIATAPDPMDLPPLGGVDGVPLSNPEAPIVLGSGVRTVQFFVSEDELEEVRLLLGRWQKELGTQNPSETLLALLRKLPVA